MIGRCVMVKGDKDERSKELRCLTLDVIKMRVAEMPERQIVIILSMTVVQGIDKRAEDRSSAIDSRNAALDSRIEHRQIRCGYTKYREP
ncbi:uncharacterized protein N7525_008965 [Penicillium rubens]|jgi:hypothetical protein|uniref:uncharacterized protein n=1 Tax=Penicillium rubens TaxID=1108849 RepID=UPI002A5A6E08|nr:uncharacterized protein N7525_008965 [Penicillium rubens]KAJ5830712.1 hypothetical protein N7525_008965 [Penicillium rubens]KAJ5854293.1 hypothetical protein N7534_006836 [Penicillium rubens]